MKIPFWILIPVAIFLIIQLIRGIEGGNGKPPVVYSDSLKNPPITGTRVL